VVIGAFNLLPAFPMDGGRIFRSLMVRRFGRLRATQIAATVGKVVAVGLVVVGIFGGGFWLALIGLFIFMGGDAEYRSLQAHAALRGLRVGDLFARRGAIVPAEATVADAAAALWRERAPVGFVVEEGRPIGAVTAEAIARVPVRERAAVAARSLMRSVPVVAPDEELGAALKQLEEQGVDAAAVVEQGRLVGTLSIEDIARGLQLREVAAG
jgi:CBS domain-containing protein